MICVEASLLVASFGCLVAIGPTKADAEWRTCIRDRYLKRHEGEQPLQVREEGSAILGTFPAEARAAFFDLDFTNWRGVRQSIALPKTGLERLHVAWMDREGRQFFELGASIGGVLGQDGWGFGLRIHDGTVATLPAFARRILDEVAERCSVSKQLSSEAKRQFSGDQTDLALMRRIATYTGMSESRLAGFSAEEVVAVVALRESYPVPYDDQTTLWIIEEKDCAIAAFAGAELLESDDIFGAVFAGREEQFSFHFKTRWERVHQNFVFQQRTMVREILRSMLDRCRDAQH